MVLQIRLFGEFSLTCDNRLVMSLNTPRLQSLLAYLVLHSNAPQMRSQIAFQFWPDSSESQAHTNLRKLVHTLRRSLPESERCLYIDHEVLQIRPDAPLEVDVTDFENTLVASVLAHKAGDQYGEQEALENALQLYKGDLLPGCYEDWVLPIREQLRQTFIYGIECLIGLLEHAHCYPEAISHTRLLLEFDPLREEDYRQLMRLHALNGERASALHTYHRCASLLRQELGVEPSRETRQAYQRILVQEETSEPGTIPGGLFLKLFYSTTMTNPLKLKPWSVLPKHFF
jgi:DNA-binding SARP family transcriptional activator